MRFGRFVLEQDKSKARKGLEIYKRSVIQHEDLQRLYATCQKMQIVNQAPALEAPPESFFGTMQEYVDTAKAGEMPAGVGARRSNRTSGGSAPPSESSPGAAAAAVVPEWRNGVAATKRKRNLGRVVWRDEHSNASAECARSAE